MNLSRTIKTRPYAVYINCLQLHPNSPQQVTSNFESFNIKYRSKQNSFDNLFKLFKLLHSLFGLIFEKIFNLDTAYANHKKSVIGKQ